MLGKPTTSVDHQMFPHCFCLPFWEDYSLICAQEKTQPCPSPASGPVQKWPKSRASTRCAYPWKISRSVDQSVSWKDSQDFNGKPNGHGDFERWVLQIFGSSGSQGKLRNAAPNSWTLGTLKFDRSFHKIPSSVAIK